MLRGSRLRAAQAGVRRALLDHQRRNLLLEVSTRQRVERSRGRASLGMLYELVHRHLSSSGNRDPFDECHSGEKLIRRAILPRSALPWTQLRSQVTDSATRGSLNGAVVRTSGLG